MLFVGAFFVVCAVIAGIVLPILALVSIVTNNFNGNDKLIWVLIVLFMPLLGSILYFILGQPKSRKDRIRNSNKHFLEY